MSEMRRSGAIINFEDTYWDLSSLSAEEKEQYLNQEIDDLLDVEEFDTNLWTEDPSAADLDVLLQEMTEEDLQKLSKLPFHRFYPQLFEEVTGLSEEAFARLFNVKLDRSRSATVYPG